MWLQLDLTSALHLLQMLVVSDESVTGGPVLTRWVGLADLRPGISITSTVRSPFSLLGQGFSYYAKIVWSSVCFLGAGENTTKKQKHSFIVDLHLH